MHNYDAKLMLKYAREMTHAELEKAALFEPGTIDALVTAGRMGTNFLKGLVPRAKSVVKAAPTQGAAALDAAKARAALSNHHAAPQRFAPNGYAEPAAQGAASFTPPGPSRTEQAIAAARAAKAAPTPLTPFVSQRPTGSARAATANREAAMALPSLGEAAVNRTTAMVPHNSGSTAMVPYNPGSTGPNRSATSTTAGSGGNTANTTAGSGGNTPPFFSRETGMTIGGAPINYGHAATAAGIGAAGLGAGYMLGGSGKRNQSETAKAAALALYEQRLAQMNAPHTQFDWF